MCSSDLRLHSTTFTNWLFGRWSILFELFRQTAVTLIPFFIHSLINAIPTAPVGPVIITFFIFIIYLLNNGFPSFSIGITIISSSSSLGRNGAKSSRGGDTKVPSGYFFVADFGSNTCSLSTKTSTMQ